MYSGKIPEQSPDLDFSTPNLSIVPQRAYDKLSEDLYWDDTLNLENAQYIFRILNELKPLTIQMIKSSESELEGLKVKAQSVVQEKGFRSLEQYGSSLKKLT